MRENLLGFTRQTRWPWCVGKVLAFGASSLTRFFSADKVCTMETGIYRFSKKERTKSQVSNITRLSPCFTLFASPEPSKCKFVLKMHNVRNDFARKCHLKSQTSKNSKINLLIYSHSKKATCSKLIKSCMADAKTATKMSPGNVGLKSLDKLECFWYLDCLYSPRRTEISRGSQFWRFLTVLRVT